MEFEDLEKNARQKDVWKSFERKGIGVTTIDILKDMCKGTYNIVIT